MSRVNIHEILKEHELWLASGGCSGTQANLKKRKLRGRNLSNCNLEQAIVEGVVLERANLENANLSSANLLNANLKNAILKNADLTGAMGLTTASLAGADLLNAKLPEQVANFDGLEHVTEISSHARTIFLTIIGACVFCWLTIATTTDAQLVANSVSAALPLINAKIPIAGFFIIGPFILIILYIYFQLYLQRLWESLSRLPSVFPDGSRLDQKAYPWLLMGLVSKYVVNLKRKRGKFFWLQYSLSILSGWILVPFTIFLFWGRYITLHEIYGSILLITCLFSMIIAGCVFYVVARKTLSNVNIDPNLFAILPSIIILLFFMGVILSVYPIYTENSLEIKIDPIPAYPLYLEINNRSLSSVKLGDKEVDFLDLLKRKLKLEEIITNTIVNGANLEGRNLRHAEASNSFLAHANLRETDLQWANLQGANLQGADLRGAKLQGAILFGANLKNADLRDADLRGATLENAHLENAILRGVVLGVGRSREPDGSYDSRPAKLIGADLRDANLIGVDLSGLQLNYAKLNDADMTAADLTNANLQDAQLHGADLTDARGMTQKQLNGACGDPVATILPSIKLLVGPCKSGF